ncbi:MAG: hypothetical protein GTO02_22395 [Candidatus Dadabacteria bacterium]|nr:hypothetical protein [Candidatus Dadabacteria bacterium]
MALSVNVDWTEDSERYELNCPNGKFHEENGYGWENLKNKKNFDGCPCCEDDSGYLQPMMNYVYPLDYTGMVDNDKCIEIASETNCILIEEKNTGDWVIALTGGGMDLSFDIARAFMIAQKWLPKDLIDDLRPDWCKQNMPAKEYAKLRRIVVQQLDNEIRNFTNQKKKWRGKKK